MDAEQQQSWRSVEMPRKYVCGKSAVGQFFVYEETGKGVLVEE